MTSQLDFETEHLVLKKASMKIARKITCLRIVVTINLLKLNDEFSCRLGEVFQTLKNNFFEQECRR
jgi:hypothetical protein